MNLLLLLVGLTSAQAASWNGQIHRPGSPAAVSLQDVASALSGASVIVLGEKHGTTAVQAAQAALITAVLELNHASFTTAWEFLNWIDRAKTDTAYAQYAAGQITALELLTQILGTDQYPSYAPILEATRHFQGALLSTNLSREQKAPVVQGGLSAIDPKLIPDGFSMGDANYFDRFVAAMAGHATDETMKNYFDAQCLTDDVIAEHVTADSATPLTFLVVGQFHTDYNDGVVARLRARAPGKAVPSIRFTDASDYTEAQLEALAQDPKYGDIADYVYYVNEPVPGR